MMPAKGREHCVTAWRAHCKELVSLALAADVPLEEYERLQAQLDGWVQAAADRWYATEETL